MSITWMYVCRVYSLQPCGPCCDDGDNLSDKVWREDHQGSMSDWCQRNYTSTTTTIITTNTTITNTKYHQASLSGWRQRNNNTTITTITTVTTFQRQLIAIWRPLCRQSPLAAADEPTLGKWGASFRGRGAKHSTSAKPTANKVFGVFYTLLCPHQQPPGSTFLTK